MRRSCVARLLQVTLVVVLVALVASPAAAGTAPQDPAEELARRYAPVVMVKEQRWPCDRVGEAFLPTSVDIVLDNPQVLLRQRGRNDPVVGIGPSAADLFDLGDGFYLDTPGVALDPGCVYERDFQRFGVDVPATVYAHVMSQPDRPDVVVVQYWFYWYYNDWNNTHEGDWEGIQLWFDTSSVDEALTMAPSSVGYAQHEGGERADWDDARLERVGDHPVVYPSAGSHASYYSRAVFLGRGPSEGFGCDDTTGPSVRVDPEVVVVPTAVTDPEDPLAWLAFEGRWGERQGGPYNGPTGPAMKDRWLHPVDWHEDLRVASVVVPGGESWAANVTRTFCGVVEWGSQRLIGAMLSPIHFVVALAGLALVGAWLVRRTIWDRVAVRPMLVRRRAGELLLAAPRRYRLSPLVFATIGAVYVPVSLFVGGVTHLLRGAPVLGALVDFDRSRGGISLVLALIVGGLGNLIASQLVGTVVAGVMAADDRGEPVTVANAVAVLRDRWRALLGALARAALIVVPLMLSVVGAPIAIWFVVRYQFVAQAVGVEGRTGWDALRRSGQLVRRRWWHTAVVTGLINAALLLISFTIGLLLLVGASGLPLWLFSAIVSVVVALAVPVASIAHTYLYADAVVSADESAAAQRLGERREVGASAVHHGEGLGDH